MPTDAGSLAAPTKPGPALLGTQREEGVGTEPGSSLGPVGNSGQAGLRGAPWRSRQAGPCAGAPAQQLCPTLLQPAGLGTGLCPPPRLQPSAFLPSLPTAGAQARVTATYFSTLTALDLRGSGHPNHTLVPTPHQHLHSPPQGPWGPWGHPSHSALASVPSVFSTPAAVGLCTMSPVRLQEPELLQSPWSTPPPSASAVRANKPCLSRLSAQAACPGAPGSHVPGAGQQT